MKYRTYKDHLEDFRKLRNFEVNKYIQMKSDAINEFFTKNSLDSAVIGISGGVDSAVTLMLLLEAKKQPNSPLKQILPLIVPIHGRGTSRQNDATDIAKRFLNSIGEKYVECDITKAYNNILFETPFTTNPWSEGQMASCLRVPVFYFHAALLQAKGYKSIVVGTTNRDEGSYIGFFGKASDGMVDLQPIADIHKSEVYKVACELGVTQEIIDAVPSGDVWDSRVDEQMIGAPYDFIELFILCKDYNHIIKLKNYISGMRSIEQYLKSINAIHNKNAHKYEVGSPAHFIDVLPRKVEGGW